MPSDLSLALNNSSAESDTMTQKCQRDYGEGHIIGDGTANAKIDVADRALTSTNNGWYNGNASDSAEQNKNHDSLIASYRLVN